MYGNYNPETEITSIQKDWEILSRWENIVRPYTAESVITLRGSIKDQNCIAQRGADELWLLLNNAKKNKKFYNALGAVTGGQALQMAKGGLKIIYLSGWQVAADNNSVSDTYPDLSLYPVDSVPRLIQGINNAFRRADQIQWSKGIYSSKSTEFVNYFLPIVGDAEAGFGGILNTYELCRRMIGAGVAGIHLEDQLASAKKCGHLGGKVLIPTKEAIQKLVAARLASDVAGVSTVIIARTDAYAATLLTSDIDPQDAPFITGDRTEEGFFHVVSGINHAIARGLAYAPYADLLWCETQTPSLSDAQLFAQEIHAKYPGKLLAYNCSPSFNWKQCLTDEEISSFQVKLGELGFVFQFVTLAGIHSMWYNMFDLAHRFAGENGLSHYVNSVQVPEFNAQSQGYTFVAHQQEVGTGYFDIITNIIHKGNASTCAMKDSTEEQQFEKI